MHGWPTVLVSSCPGAGPGVATTNGGVAPPTSALRYPGQRLTTMGSGAGRASGLRHEQAPARFHCDHPSTVLKRFTGRVNRQTA